MANKYKNALIICALIFTGTVALSQIAAAGERSSLKSESDRIAQLESRADTLSAALAQDTNDVVQSVAGANPDRIAADKEIAESFIRKATTWSSGAEYAALRSEIKEEYQLSEDDQFLAVFLPPIVTEVDGQPVSNEADLYDLNMTFKSIDPRLTNIDGSKYTYFSPVTVRSENEYGSGEGTFIFTYTVNENGTLSGLGGWAVAE